MSVCFKLLSCRQGLQLRSWPSTNALLQFNKSIILNAATCTPTNSALPSILPRRYFSSSPSLSATQNDYYQRLGVSEKATAAEIKAAYFRLSKLHHPDVNQSDQASTIFLKLREAYDVLGNAQKRNEYDKSRNIHKEYKIVKDVNPPGVLSQGKLHRLFSYCILKIIGKRINKAYRHKSHASSSATDRQTVRQTDRQTDRQTVRQTDRQTDRP